VRSHFMLGLCAATSAAGLIADGGRAGSLIAADAATDPAYDDGWDPGDNGGFGFDAWNFDGTYSSPIQHAMDDGSAVHNQLGRAWTIYNPDAPPSTGTDISSAGRGFPVLSTGQRLRVVIDNPIQRQFFRGYTIRLNSGGSNTCFMMGCTPGTDPVTKFSVGTFEYFTNGEWYATPGGGFAENIFDTETDGGVQIDFTLTSASTLEVVMLPLDNPGFAETASGTLTNPATEPIDWIEFELYNTDSDFHPKVIADPQATDFYIRELEIEQVPEPGAPILWAVGGTVLLLVRRKSLARTTRAYG
jgi:hypothetical protein